MKVLRATMWPPPADNGPPSAKDGPVTMVMRDSDMTLPLEDVARHVSAPLVEGAAFIVLEVFTAPDGTSIETVTLEGQRRARKRAASEKNMAIAFYYYVGWLPRMNPGGVVTATKPAPLEADDLATVAEQLARQTVYQGQTVLQIAKDGRLVWLRAGTVTIEDAP